MQPTNETQKKACIYCLAILHAKQYLSNINLLMLQDIKSS